jgi:hypothetical protein
LSGYSFAATTNRTLVANFIQTYIITASANPSNAGTTTGAGTYRSGTNVNLTATANTGYEFVNWTENGSVVSTLSGYTFAASTNRTLVANFMPKLEIVRSANSSLIVSWPVSTTVYQLKRASILESTNTLWLDVTNSISVVGDRNQMVVMPSDNHYFILVRP